MRSRPLPPVAGRCAIKHRAAPLTYNVGPHIFGYFDDRLTKNDVLKYLEDKKDKNTISNTTIKEEIQITNKIIQPTYTPKTTTQLEDTIIEMDRVRKIISKNMLDSKRISAHVSSFVECDITNIVKWRNKNKDNFKLKYGFNLTYLPVFIEAIAQCIKEFPNINV